MIFFRRSQRALIAYISNSGQIVVGFLGTEPALFVLPTGESRFIDFGERKRQLKAIEERIRERKGGGDQPGLPSSKSRFELLAVCGDVVQLELESPTIRPSDSTVMLFFLFADELCSNRT